MTDFYTTQPLGRMQSLTPEGFLIVRAVPLARTGAQLCSDRELPLQGDSAGNILIDREAEDVFAPATIASLNGKPVCLDHPDDDVTPENYTDLAVGHVVNPRRGQYANDHLLYGDLVITHPAAIEAIRNKELRELSVGYKADYIQTGPGRGRQQNIIANHLALVRDGRCGIACRIGDKAFYAKDAAMNNLGKNGKQAFLPGDWSKDQSAGTSTGSQGSATGGAPRRAERPSTPPSLREGVFTTNSALQPGGFTNHDDEPDTDETEGREKLGEVDPPPEGYILQLVPQPDGSIGIICVPDMGEDLSTNDRTYKHRISDGVDPVIKRMNSIARRHWSKTKDWASSVPGSLFRHKNLARGERLALEGPNKFGTFDLVLYTPVKNLIGEPLGGSANAKEPRARRLQGPQAWSASPGSKPEELSIHEIQDGVRSADSRTRMTLAKMNQIHRQHWAKSA